VTAFSIYSSAGRTGAFSAKLSLQLDDDNGNSTGEFGTAGEAEVQSMVEPPDRTQIGERERGLVKCYVSTSLHTAAAKKRYREVPSGGELSTPAKMGEQVVFGGVGKDSAVPRKKTKKTELPQRQNHRLRVKKNSL